MTQTPALPLGSYAVRTNKGTIDQDATFMKFRADLSRFVAERETEEATIAEAVSSVFDQFKGARLNMPALTSATLQWLNTQPTDFKVMSDRVQEYVRSNAGERGKALFNIGKGKGGGVLRWADQPEKTENAA